MNTLGTRREFLKTIIGGAAVIGAATAGLFLGKDVAASIPDVTLPTPEGHGHIPHEEVIIKRLLYGYHKPSTIFWESKETEELHITRTLHPSKGERVTHTITRVRLTTIAPNKYCYKIRSDSDAARTREFIYADKGEDYRTVSKRIIIALEQNDKKFERHLHSLAQA